MKKLFIPVALFALVATGLMSSCKKDDSSPATRSQMMVGTWKSDQEGTDSNANGVWDASEHKTTAAADVSTSVFNADGTGSAVGTFSGVPITIPFKWNLQNSDNDLRLIANVLGSDDTSIQTIISISSSDLVTKDASTMPVSFTSLKKQ